MEQHLAPEVKPAPWLYIHIMMWNSGCFCSRSRTDLRKVRPCAACKPSEMRLFRGCYCHGMRQMTSILKASFGPAKLNRLPPVPSFVWHLGFSMPMVGPVPGMPCIQEHSSYGSATATTAVRASGATDSWYRHLKTFQYGGSDVTIRSCPSHHVCGAELCERLLCIELAVHKSLCSA
jgi:hypothetical protein